MLEPLQCETLSPHAKYPFRAPVAWQLPSPLQPVTRQHCLATIPVLDPYPDQRTNRAELHAAFARTNTNVNGADIATPASLKWLQSFAANVRAEITGKLGNFVSARKEIIDATGNDPMTYAHAFGHLWDRDVPKWLAQTAEISKVGKTKLATVHERIEAFQGQIIKLYPIGAEPFDVEIIGCSSSDTLGTFIKVRSLKPKHIANFGRAYAGTEYTFSLETFERLQQKPTAEHPVSAEKPQVETYLQNVFAASQLHLEKATKQGNDWKITCHTREGRKYTIHATTTITQRGSDFETDLVIKSITDWQSIITSSHYQAFTGYKVTTVNLNLVAGKSNFLHTEYTNGRPRTEKLSLLERGLAKVKRFFV